MTQPQEIIVQNGENTQTVSRKRDHVDLCVNQNVAFRSKSNGLDRVEFVHNALPECNFSDVTTQAEFLGYRLSMPFLVSSMTGGYSEAEEINRALARVCEQRGLAMGLGSQRQAIQNSQYHGSFRVARTTAPSIPLIANIGGPEVAKAEYRLRITEIIELIEATALAIHLNPLQELMQPEGTPDFRGVLDGIATLTAKIPIPIIVKEVGAGLSESVAKRLLEAGVQILDVAGAGGTSWSGVEILRAGSKEDDEPFWDWGIPTADCLRSISALKATASFVLIGSGGISNGIEAAKAFALGADMVASARPVLQALKSGGEPAVHAFLDSWELQLRRVMFLTGSVNITTLQKADVVLSYPTP